ncbi:uncharacterized protein LOC112576507 [Pomacea canaliculata]|uniref:uncharacterized protein LOC112576507 n=1 Tax=Pomacea canaliculata TaxID=400727 RepID=UPI000D72D94F|nr:uncharacterized protein LOC112576507 [Pomacea canaliculata]
MEKQHQEKEVTGGKLPEGFQFPLQSSEDVDHLEWDWKTDPGKWTHLECHLTMGGIFTLKHVVRSILSVLLSTDSARCYNFNGLKEKKGLKNHSFILQTVQDAARKSYPEATDADLHVYTSIWLAGARDRENSRREGPEHSLYKSVNCYGVDDE